MSKISIRIQRSGENVYVTGLLYIMGATQLVPSLTKKDLMVEEGKRVYLSIETLAGGELLALLRRSKDDTILHAQHMNDGSGVISYDPWDHV